MSPRAVQLAGLALLVLACQAALAVEPLKCPDGARLESEAGANQSRTESCVRADTGIKQGPARELRADGSVAAIGANDAGKPNGVARIYNEQEVLLGEITFDHGNVKGQHFTLAGLANYLDKMNERLRAEHKPYIVRAIDEATIGVDFQFADASARTGGERIAQFRQQVQSSFCGMFEGGRKQLETLRVRVFNADEKKPQTEFAIVRTDCLATATNPH